MSDVVNHPAHYAEGWSNGAEVIDITENLNFNRGNAVKYLARAGKKDPARELEDLFKAQWYINREIKRVEAAQDARKERFKELGEYFHKDLAEAMAEQETLPDGSLASDALMTNLREKISAEREIDEKLPRTWRSLADVPDGKIVTDKEGDEWYRDNADRYHYRQGKDSEGYGYLSEWRRSPDPIEVDDAEFGPFTEVID